MKPRDDFSDVDPKNQRTFASFHSALSLRQAVSLWLPQHFGPGLCETRAPGNPTLQPANMNSATC